jgi:hypothetical protein
VTVLADNLKNYPLFFDIFGFLADKFLFSFHGPTHKGFTFNYSSRTKLFVRALLHSIIFSLEGSSENPFYLQKFSNHFGAIHKNLKGPVRAPR